MHQCGQRIPVQGCHEAEQASDRVVDPDQVWSGYGATQAPPVW